jgi:2-dehydropantoate 2-reductase
MRHAILGVGGVGGLVGAALARNGQEVLLLLRPERLAAYDGRLVVESAVLGDFSVELAASGQLDREVDVLWITTKATQLEQALELAPPTAVGDATVIPLLNGIDHVAALRRRHRRVVAGAIRVESERTADGRIEQPSPFLRVDLAGAEAVAEELGRADITCKVRDDETTLLWEKLAILAPIALATTALDGPLGSVRNDPRLEGCREEALAVAAAEGARIEVEPLRALQANAPATTRSSMQKDVAAGRPPEVDAIAGPILRGGARHGIPTPCTGELAGLVEERLS